MKSGSPTNQVSGHFLARAHGVAAELGREWREGKAPTLEDFLAEWSALESGLSTHELASLISLDQRERWRRGQRPAAEDYLLRFPQLAADEELALDVIYGEFLLREELGEQPEARDYQARFPVFADTLLDQIEFHQAMAADGSRGPLAQDTHRSTSPTQPSGAREARLPAHLTHFVPGYEILSELGRGGMGIVYRARQLSLNRLVALKMLRAGDCGSATLLARFQAEAEAVARLHHPNIVQIYDYGEHDGMPYLALELVEGGPLSAEPKGATWTSHEAAQIVITLARAVQFAHEQGIVHRDLKPANVLVSVPAADSSPGRMTIKITDFGLAKVFREGEESHTQTGTIVGTPSYMAPEQARGNSLLVGPGTDVYALGAILYELLTGRPPFKALTAIETLHQVLTIEVASPTRHVPALPRDLATIVLKCLQKAPQRRYNSAAELADDLERFLEDRPVRARPVTAAERSWRWCRRNPVLALLATTVALLLIAVTTVSSISSVRLSAQLKKTERAKSAERDARQTAQLRLWDAYLAEMNARTASRQIGHRFAVLETGQQAGVLLDKIGRTPDRELNLRSATIAALALPDMRRLKLIEGQKARALDCALAAGRYVTASTNGALTLFDLQGRELLRIGHRGTEAGPVISCDGQYIGVSDLAGSKIWRVEDGRAIPVWEEPGATRLALAPDCHHAAVLGADQIMRWLDLETGQNVRQLGRGPGRSAFSFNASSRRIAVVGTKGVQIIGWETGEVLAELPSSPTSVADVAWHPGGEFVAVCGEDEGVGLWHVATRRRVLAYPHVGVVRAYFVAGGDYVLTHNIWDAHLRMWHTGTGQEVLSDPTFPHFQCEPMPNGQQLLLALDEAGVALWEVEPARACTSLPHGLTPSIGWRISVAISPDDRWLLIGGLRGLELWDLESMQPAAQLESGLAYANFASDGSIIARFSSGVYRWPQTEEAGEVGGRLCFGPPDKLYGATIDPRFAISPDASLLFVRTSAGWQAISRRAPERPVAIDPEVDPRIVSLSGDSRWLAFGSWNGHGVFILSQGTGERVAHLQTGPHACPLFSPDGRWLATTPDGVRLWSTSDWQPATEISARGDTASELGIAFSPDSSVLAVSEPTGATRLVDPTTGRDWAVLSHPDRSSGTHLPFSRDQARLVAAPIVEGRPVRVWNLAAIRTELASRGLDWPPDVLPPRAAGHPAAVQAPQVSFDRGESWAKEEAAALLGAVRVSQPATRRDLLMQIVRLDPANGYAHNALSWLLSTGPAELRDPALAVAHAHRAVALDSSNHNYMNSLGVALQRAGQHTEAVVVLEDSLKRSTPELAAYDLVFLALAHARLANWQVASDYFRQTTVTLDSQRDKLTLGHRDELQQFLEEAKNLGLPR